MFLKRLLNYILINKSLKYKENVYKCQKRSAYYQQWRSGEKKVDEEREEMWDQLTEWDKITGSYKLMKQEFRLWRQEMSDQYSIDADINDFSNKEVVKLWDFDQRNNERISSFHNNRWECNDMNRWRTACDSDHNEGYSSCDWTVSPTGRALFTGYLDTRVPKDGRMMRSGFAFVGCEKHRKSFYRPDYFDWQTFTHLLVRCRGDGRNWFIILNTSDDYADITWFDRYQYVLYIHGGPYWQWCKIPFSRFYLQHKSYLQERQPPIPLYNVSQIGFLLADQNTGAFNLEIDYVGAMRDEDWKEETAYEKYYHKENPYPSPGTT